MSSNPAPSDRVGRPADTSVRVLSVDTGVWICLLVVVLILQVRLGLESTLGQDSLQYLSVARNALDGRVGYTSLVHFDAERSFGVIPAPMVTFPSGYAFAIALTGLTGLPLATAGLLISFVSMVASVPLLAWVSRELCLSRMAGNAVLAGFVTNASVIQMATKVASDSLFSVLVLLGVGTFVLARRRHGNDSNWLWMGLGLAFAAAYTVRYAAMFFIVGLALVAIRQLLASNRELAGRIALAVAVAGFAAIAGIARNIMLVGNWRGGNDKPVSNSIATVLLETARGVNRLLLGPGSGVEGGTTVPRAALIVLFVAALAVLMRRQTRSRAIWQTAMEPGSTTSVALDLLLLALAYLACLFYAGLKSVIDYGDPRYVAPVLPIFLLLLAFALQAMIAAASGVAQRLSILALAASLAIYGYLNLLILRSPQRAGWLQIAAALDTESTAGRSSRAVVQEIVGVDGVVIANSGQTVGHLLERRTVSLVGAHFSTIEWDERSVLDVARRFNAKAVVVYAPSSEDDWKDGGVIPSDFVRRLAQGDAPTWLHLQHRTETLLVYVPRIEGQ